MKNIKKYTLIWTWLLSIIWISFSVSGIVRNKDEILDAIKELKETNKEEKYYAWILSFKKKKTIQDRKNELVKIFSLIWNAIKWEFSLFWKKAKNTTLKIYESSSDILAAWIILNTILPDFSSAYSDGGSFDGGSSWWE